jgi:hypothetical protein
MRNRGRGVNGCSVFSQAHRLTGAKVQLPTAQPRSSCGSLLLGLNDNPHRRALFRSGERGGIDAWTGDAGVVIFPFGAAVSAAVAHVAVCRDGGAFYGTTLRIYDPGLDAWHIIWSDPVRQLYGRQIGRADGGDIVQDGTTANGTRIRWSFTEITADSFHWRGERWDEAAAWRLRTEYFARRVGGGRRLKPKNLRFAREGADRGLPLEEDDDGQGARAHHPGEVSREEFLVPPAMSASALAKV